MPLHRPGRTLLSVAGVVLATGIALIPAPAERVNKDPEIAPIPVPHSVVREEPPSGGGPSLDQTGSWTPPEDWPANSVHLILLHTGKVLFWRGDEDAPVSYLWDPQTNQMETQSAGDIIFCSGHAVLEDGRVMVTGGEVTQNTGLGNVYTHIFDPISRAWTRSVDMRRGRYYPTATTLGDGRVLTFSGTDETGLTNDLVEAFVAGSGGAPDTWQLLSGATRRMTYYPRMHLLPGGQVLHTGPERTTDLLEPISGTWATLPASNYGKRTQGSSVMLPPGFNKIMILGGRDRSQADPLATNTAEIIDMSAPEPSWRYTAPMSERRMNLNAVILPDATVLVAGGTSDENITPSYGTELFDPATETWTPLAPMSSHRGYHSSAILLPDGRVLWAGANGNYTAEIFSPPYLYRGARPVITTAPLSVQYGESFSIASPDTGSITSVVLMRTGVSTHAFDMAQRYVPLSWSANTDVIEATAPSEPNTAPPGWYMLFLVNGSGVPSVASFVHLAGSVLGNRPPAVDAGLNRTVVYPQTTFLTGAVADDGLPAPPTLSTLWTMDSGPATATFASPSSLTTSASFPTPGTYVLRLTVSDGELIGSDFVTVLVTTVGETGYPIESRVLSNKDDGEEHVGTGDVTLSSTDLEMTFDDVEQLVGLRFTNLPIPNGETIIRAWIQFTADETQSDSTNLTIRGQASDDVPVFVSSLFSLSSRPRTTASVSWTPLPWDIEGETGARQRTADLSPVIQEIVNRPGWVSGNAVALFISGTGHRTAEAFDGGSPGATLHVEVATPPVNNAPQVDAGLGQTIRLPAPAVLDGSVSDDGLPLPPGIVRPLWVQESGPGLAIFADPHVVDTTVSFTAPGRYELALTADDSELSTAEHLVIDVLEELPQVAYSTSLITAATDDVEEEADNGTMNLDSSDLEMTMDNPELQLIGLRFQAVDLPETALVHRAWIQFMADEASSSATLLTVQGLTQAQPGTFIAAKFDLSARPRTTESVSWSVPAWNVVDEAGAGQRTPDLTTIIQELRALPGHASGGPMAFVITGNGWRVARAYEQDPAKAARLVIEYTEAPPPAPAH